MNSPSARKAGPGVEGLAGQAVGQRVERGGEGAFDYTLHAGSKPTQKQWYFREQLTMPVAVQRWQLPPGGSEGAHTHRGNDEEPLEELYLVIEGEVEMTLDGFVEHLRAGDAVHVPLEVEQDLRNTGEEHAVVLVIWGPAGSEGPGMECKRYGSGRVARAASPTPAASPPPAQRPEPAQAVPDNER